MAGVQGLGHLLLLVLGELGGVRSAGDTARAQLATRPVVLGLAAIFAFVLRHFNLPCSQTARQPPTDLLSSSTPARRRDHAQHPVTKTPDPVARSAPGSG